MSRTPDNTPPDDWSDEERQFFYAGWNDCVKKQPGALGAILKLCDECSEPNGWLATNVRHAAKAALAFSSRAPTEEKT